MQTRTVIERHLLVECIRRDEEAAKDAKGRGEDPEFFLERARGYRQDLEAYGPASPHEHPDHR